MGTQDIFTPTPTPTPTPMPMPAGAGSPQVSPQDGTLPSLPPLPEDILAGLREKYGDDLIQKPDGELVLREPGFDGPIDTRYGEGQWAVGDEFFIVGSGPGMKLIPRDGVPGSGNGNGNGEPNYVKDVYDKVFDAASVIYPKSVAFDIAHNYLENIGKDRIKLGGAAFLDILNVNAAVDAGHRIYQDNLIAGMGAKFDTHWNTLLGKLLQDKHDQTLSRDDRDNIEVFLENQKKYRPIYKSGFLNLYIYGDEEFEPVTLDDAAVGKSLKDFFLSARDDLRGKVPGGLDRYIDTAFIETEAEIIRTTERRAEYNDEIESYDADIQRLLDSPDFDENFKEKLSGVWSKWKRNFQPKEADAFAFAADDLYPSAADYIKAKEVAKVGSINSAVINAFAGTPYGTEALELSPTLHKTLSELPYIRDRMRFITEGMQKIEIVEGEIGEVKIGEAKITAKDLGKMFDDARGDTGTSSEAFSSAEIKLAGDIRSARVAHKKATDRTSAISQIKDRLDQPNVPESIRSEWTPEKIAEYVDGKIKIGITIPNSITYDFQYEHLRTVVVEPSLRPDAISRIKTYLSAEDPEVAGKFDDAAIGTFVDNQIDANMRSAEGIASLFRSTKLKTERESFEETKEETKRASEFAKHVDTALKKPGVPPEASGYYTEAVLAKFLEDAAGKLATAESLFDADYASKLNRFTVLGDQGAFTPTEPTKPTEPIVEGTEADKLWAEHLQTKAAADKLWAEYQKGKAAGATVGGTLGEWLRKQRPGNTALVDTYLGQIDALWAEAEAAVAAGQAANEEAYIKSKFNAQAAEDIGTVKKELELNAQGFMTRDAQGNRLQAFDDYIASGEPFSPTVHRLARFHTSAGAPVEGMPGSQAERERRAAEAQAPGPLGLFGFAQSIGVNFQKRDEEVRDMTPEEKKAYDDLQGYMADLTSGERPFDENAKVFLLSKSPIVREMQNLGVRAGLSGEEIDALVTKVNTAAFDKFGGGAGAVLQQEIDTLTARNREVYEQALDLEDEFIGTMDSEMLAEGQALPPKTEGQVLPPQKQWIETDKQGTSRLVSTAQAGLAQGDTPHERARSEILRRQKEGLSAFEYSPEEIEARTKSKAAAQGRTAKLSEIQAAQANELERQKRIADRQRLRGQGSAPPPGAGTGPTGERRA